ncbi:hypothetical protein FKP32DRAFT_1231148 [Trametes sanguinea]|nr:hypothetical protein FKP32DRAFT_1231148 [Trametes sanguinea]
MDPDFIREQAKNVWRVLATNAKVIQDRNLTIEGAFVGADFVQNQASVLFDAVADSVNLRANHARDHQFYILKPEFLSHQGSALKAVLDDSARLQDTSQTTFSGLSSLNDEFILDVVSQLHAIVDGNTSIAMQYQVQPNTLYMSHPSFIARLMLAFHSVMSSYVQNRKGMIVQQQRVSCGPHERLCLDHSLSPFR